MTTPTQGEHAKTELAHELFAAAQLAPGEGIEDAVRRITAALTAATAQPAAPQGVAYAELTDAEIEAIALQEIGFDGGLQQVNGMDIKSIVRAAERKLASNGQAPAGAAIHPQIQATLAKLDVPVRGYLASHSGTLHPTADKVNSMESAVPLVSQHDHRNACETIIKLLSMKDAS